MPRILMAVILALLAPGCGTGPGQVVADATPMPSAAAALHWSVETPEGRFLGSATAFGPHRLLTNAHVLAAARGRAIVVRRGAERIPVRASNPLPAVDAAMLQVEATGVAMPEVRPTAPAEAERVFVAGPQAGRGRMLAASAARRFGHDLIAARLPVARGYSGAPVVDADGRLIGIVGAAVAEDLQTARRLAAQSDDEAPSCWVTLVVPVRTILERIPSGRPHHPNG